MENVGSLLNGAGIMVTMDTEKAEELKSFFTLVFSGKTGLGVPERRAQCLPASALL